MMSVKNDGFYTVGPSKVVDPKTQTVEFVEFINVPFLNVSNEVSDSHIIDGANTTNVDVEYLLSNSDLNGHVIFVHDGKQFLIPRDQLKDTKGDIVMDSDSSAHNNLIVPDQICQFEMQCTDYGGTDLQDATVESSLNFQEEFDVTNELDVSSLQTEVESTDSNSELIANPLEVNGRKQYAILRDGQLFIQEGDINEDELIESDSHETNFDTAFNNEIEGTFSDDLTTELPTFGIAGRNLITGQTISLDSFITKLSTKNNMYENPSDQIKDEGSVEKSVGPSTIARPITKTNSKITGKRIIGKILEIKRPGDATQSINSETQVTSTTRNMVQTSGKRLKTTITSTIPAPSPEMTELLDIDEPMSNGKLCRNNQFEFCNDPLDGSILKTLTGLMDMDSFAKHLMDKNLIIKKTLKKINSETEQCFHKQVTYYKGTMEKMHTLNLLNDVCQRWEFQQNTEIDHIKEESSEMEDQDNIDLTVNTSDTQQIDIKNVSEEGESQDTTCDEESNFNIGGVDSKKHVDCVSIPTEVMVHINVIEDENGLKRTKVMVPQMYDSSRYCSICNKIYRSPLQYRRHLKVSHMPVESKLHTCDLCNKKFFDASTLSRHRRIHNGDKNYQCNLCFKAFNTTGSLKRHITIHIPSLRPLQCLKCLQRFTDESSLKKHMLLHTGLKPYECDICFKRFVHLGDLNFHRKIHDLLKQYTCETCGKDFSRHSNLIRHLEIHKDNGNLFKCDICGCSYNFMSSLTRHIVNNHMKES